MYKFDEPLQEGIVIRRASQFTMLVSLKGKEFMAHCPTTMRIGDIDVKNLACLLSYSHDPKRKMPYTVEAISCDELNLPNKNWVGINQVLSNRLVENLLVNHQLDNILSDYNEVKREVVLGKSKLDFKAGDHYLEVKTSLTEIQVTYGSHIKTKKQTPFSSTERFMKHVNELAESQTEHERAYLISVFQYVITQPKDAHYSTNTEEVGSVVKSAMEKGVKFYDIEFVFKPEGVELYRVSETKL